MKYNKPCLRELVRARRAGALMMIAGMLLTAQQMSFASIALAEEVELKLDTSHALNAYCDGLAKYDQLLEEADARFGIEGTDEKLAWIKAGDEKIAQSVSDIVGTTPAELHVLASQNDWQSKCTENR